MSDSLCNDCPPQYVTDGLKCETCPRRHRPATPSSPTEVIKAALDSYDRPFAISDAAGKIYRALRDAGLLK